MGRLTFLPRAFEQLLNRDALRPLHQKSQCMQWRCDAITVSFAVLVVALASLVPFSVAASLLALEATFAIAYAPLRLKQLALNQLKLGENQLDTADAAEEASFGV